MYNPLGWIDPLGLIHGNSKNSTKPNHVYEIRNKATGEVYKYGVSGGKIRGDGQGESMKRMFFIQK
ncbi:hypothetical protein QE94_004538 [Salmonella enterica subsp. enterica]|nr:hypothetical protein [Salmonella enterica subsp. enterica]